MMRPKLPKTFEFALVLTDHDGADAVAASGDHQPRCFEADEIVPLVGRVMEAFIRNGYKVCCPLNNPGVWVAVQGEYRVDIQLIAIGVN